LANLHWSYYILLISLSIAVYTDTTRQKLYNWLTFPTLAAGLIFAYARGGGPELFSAFLGFLFAFGVAFILFVTKGIKAGDVKLIAAVGAWVGKSLILQTFVLIFLAGGILSILATLRYGTFLATMAKVKRFFVALFVPGMNPQGELQESLNKYVPYGIAIAVGTVLSLLYPNFLFGLK
jgi:prepilin peptidase CpaA